MLQSGCQRLGARLCCMRSGLRAFESGHRNLVSCIDRKARLRVQVFGRWEGPRSALSPPEVCTSVIPGLAALGRSPSARLPTPAGHGRHGRWWAATPSWPSWWLPWLPSVSLISACCAPGPHMLLAHAQIRLGCEARFLKRVLQAFHCFLNPVLTPALSSCLGELGVFCLKGCHPTAW